jgi:hypothetical protein
MLVPDSAATLLHSACRVTQWTPKNIPSLHYPQCLSWERGNVHLAKCRLGRTSSRCQCTWNSDLFELKIMERACSRPNRILKNGFPAPGESHRLNRFSGFFWTLLAALGQQKAHWQNGVYSWQPKCKRNDVQQPSELPHYSRMWLGIASKKRVDNRYRVRLKLLRISLLVRAEVEISFNRTILL